jgi:hypothetical protein
MASKAHPGFAAVQSKIAKQQGVSADRAGAILAASSRGASKAAKKKNPRLKKVGGSPQRDMAKAMVDQSAPKQRKFTPPTKFGGSK